VVIDVGRCPCRAGVWFSPSWNLLHDGQGQGGNLPPVSAAVVGELSWIGH